MLKTAEAGVMVEPCLSSSMPKLGDGTLLYVYVFGESAPPAAAAAELGAPSAAPGLLPAVLSWFASSSLQLLPTLLL
jgi:hypothetical protein